MRHLFKVTVKEVSTGLCVNEETVRRWIRSGKLKASIDSRKEGYYISVSDLQDFVDVNPKYKTRFESFYNTTKIGKFTKAFSESMRILPCLLQYRLMVANTLGNLNEKEV